MFYFLIKIQKCHLFDQSLFKLDGGRVSTTVPLFLVGGEVKIWMFLILFPFFFGGGGYLTISLEAFSRGTPVNFFFDKEPDPANDSLKDE